MQTSKLVITTEDDDVIAFTARCRLLALELMVELISNGFNAVLHGRRKVVYRGDNVKGAKQVANRI